MKDMKVSNKTLLIGIFVLSFVILLINVYYLFCLNKNNVSTVYYPFSSPREFLLSLAGNSYKYGNETAPIVFIVFSEHGCPFCTQAHFNVENLIREEYTYEEYKKYSDYAYSCSPSYKILWYYTLCVFNFIQDILLDIRYYNGFLKKYYK